MGTMQYSFLIFLAFCAAASWTPTGARVIHKRAAFYLANDTMCIVDGDVYRNGDPVPTDDECEKCTCRPPGFSCVLRDCDTKPGCKAVRRAGECCPEYVCGCVHNNRVYEDGEIIKDLQNNCYTCRCHGSSISCTFAECLFRGDCPPEYVQGECCPRYDHCPPLSTTSSSTIFTTESTTQSEIFQQKEVFLNITTQHLEKFTNEDTTLTVVDIFPSSTTTTTTQAYSEETSTPTTVTVKFTLTVGPVTSITDLDLNTLTTLLPLQTSTYTETTKYVVPDENELKLTSTSSSISDVSDTDSASEVEVLFSTEAAGSKKEEFFTSTANIVTESTKVTTPSPNSLLEQDTSEKIPDATSSDENASDNTSTKNESVPLDGILGLGLDFNETDDHSQTPTDTVVTDFPTTSHESIQFFDGEETDSDVESVSANISSETSTDSGVYSSTVHEDEHLLTESSGKPYELSTTTESSLSTGLIKDEINLFSESTHNETGDSNATEFITITSYSKNPTESEYELNTASTTVETQDLSTESAEVFDGEDTLSTNELDKLSAETDTLPVSSETLSTEKSSGETIVAVDSTTSQSFKQTIEEQETTTIYTSVHSEEDEKYYFTQKTEEYEEIAPTTTTSQTTKPSSEIDESLFELKNQSTTLGQVTESSTERDGSKDWEEATQTTGSTDSQTSNVEDKESTIKPSEHSTDLEFSVELDNFTEYPLSSSEANKESEDLSTEMESETTANYDNIYSSTIVSTSKTTEQSLISDSPHVLETEFSEIIVKNSSDKTLEESNTVEDFHSSSDSYLLSAVSSGTSTSADDTDFSKSSTSVKEPQSASSVLAEAYTSNEYSSTVFDMFSANHESTSQGTISDVVPETTTELLFNENSFLTENKKMDDPENENISEQSIADLSENSETATSVPSEISESVISEEEKETTEDFIENSGFTVEPVFASVSTTDSNRNESQSMFSTISESTTQDDLIQDSEADTTSNTSKRIKESISTESVTDAIFNVSGNEVTTTLIGQTEQDIRESEALQSNFDTVVSNQQTTTSGENFDYELSEHANELVSDSAESVSTSTSKYSSSEEDNNAESLYDSNADRNTTLENIHKENDASDLNAVFLFKENDTEEISQFSTTSTIDINVTSSPLLNDTKTKDGEITKTNENQSYDSTYISFDIDITTTKVSVDANDTLITSDESENENSIGFNEDFISILNNDHDDSSSELKTSYVNKPSNDVPALTLFGQESNETNNTLKITPSYSGYTVSDEQTESDKLGTSSEVEDFDFSHNLYDKEGVPSSSDDDYALDSEENISEETNGHPALDLTHASETEGQKPTSSGETETNSPTETTFQQTKASSFVVDEDFKNEENNSDSKEEVVKDSYKNGINTAIDSEEKPVTPTVNRNTEEIQFIGEFTSEKAEDDGKLSTNIRNTENQKLDLTTPVQDSSNAKLTTLSLEQTLNTEDDIFIGTDENEPHTDEMSQKETILNAENFTDTIFHSSDDNSSAEFHDDIPLSKSNENKTLHFDVEDHTSKIKVYEFIGKIKDEIPASEENYVNSNEDKTSEETFEGEESLSENTVITVKNATDFSDEFDVSNQGNENETFEKSGLLLSSAVSSNDNPSSTSTFSINNNPKDKNSHVEINGGDNFSTSNVQILFDQNNSDVKTSENPVNNFKTSDSTTMTENNDIESSSSEDFSTVDENTFGEAMHEYGDDHEKHDVLKLTSTVSPNTQTTNQDQPIDYHDIELDSEEEAEEYFSNNVTGPSVSYRVETARNLDDSTTSDNLSVGNESSSLSVESLSKTEVSNTEKNSNISEMGEKSEDASINPTVKASYLHGDSKTFNDFGDHFSGGNLYSTFVIPSNINHNKADESLQQNQPNRTESGEYEADDKNDIEHVSLDNSSNSATFPKKSFEAYGYLGGVFITGKSKYNDQKKDSQGASHSSKDEIDAKESKQVIVTTETPSPIFDSEMEVGKNNEDISRSKGKNESESLQKLMVSSTENIISSNTPLLHSNATNEISEEHNLQVSSESSKNSSGPEKGGEWLEPTLAPSNGVALLHSRSQQISSKEGEESAVELNDYSTSPDAASEQNHKGPEKGGEVFEPTISNPFHLDQKLGQNEKDDHSSHEKIAIATESPSTEEKSNFATDLPIYVLSRVKEGISPSALQSNSTQEVDSKGNIMKDIPSDYLKMNSSQINKENSKMEIPSFPHTILNETSTYLHDSPNIFTDALNETEEYNLNSTLNESIPMPDENNASLLHSYSLIDVISNVFKAPGYDSEVHSHFLKEQVNYSGKEEPVVLVKRNADIFQDKIDFEKETSVKPNRNSKINYDKINPHVLQTKKNIYREISPASSTNSRPQDPPPAKVTSSFIFVVSPNDNNSDANKPSAQEVELPNDNMFSQNNAQNTRN